MLQDQWQSIEAPEEGSACTFSLHIAGAPAEGFVLRFKDRLHAYINRCPHAGSTLDWVPGRFFSPDGKMLLCQTHGAMFAPDDGACLAGPCPQGLTPLPLKEQDNGLLVPLRLQHRP